jgi:hypothetical protein
MQVHIFLAENNKVQLLLDGQAQGAAIFSDFDMFVRFIEGCQKFINRQSKTADGKTEVPKPFLDAFDDCDSS